MDGSKLGVILMQKPQADGRILHIHMKTAGAPSNGPPSAPMRKVPTEPRLETPIDLTRSEQAASYDSQREQVDRQKRADPEFQDGSYGFAAKEDEMEVDTEVLGADKPGVATPLGEFNRSHDDRRDKRGSERRDDRRDIRYDGPRNGGRGRPYFDRDREGGRPRNDYRLHSDDLYPRPGGRGFR